MIGQRLVDEVHKEAELLVKYITKEERSRLHITNLDPQSKYRCIYGQLTEHCESDRAIDLLKLCAKPLYKDIIKAPCELPKAAPMKRLLKRSRGTQHWFSAIEIYIAQDDADIKQLVRYLKGKIKTLDLSASIDC